MTISQNPQIVALDDDDVLVTSAELRRIAGGVSDMTIWRWVHDGLIPAPTKIRGRNFWAKRPTVRALLRQRQ